LNLYLNSESGTAIELKGMIVMQVIRPLAGVVVFSALLVGRIAVADIVDVTPNNMGTWAFYSTDAGGAINMGSGSGQMVDGPGTPPLGIGSANLNVGANNGDQSVQLRNSDWAGTRLDALTSLSYSTYATSWNGSQLPFVNLYLNYGTGTTRDDRLWFEPTYSSAGAGNGNPNPQANVAQGQWQTWNMLTGMWYAEDGNSGPGSNAITFAAYLALHPDATIINDPSQGGLGGIRIASGFASPEDNFNTNVDAFTIGTSSGTTTYNFEPAAVPEPSRVIALVGLGGMALIGLLWRLRQPATVL
jgi:hypothetical protein